MVSGEHGPLQASARLASFGRWIDPGGPMRWAWHAACGAVPFGSTHLVEDGGSLLGQPGPFSGLGPITTRFKHAVGDCDLVAGPVGLRAPSAPGRAAAAVSVEGGFDVERVVAPYGPSCGCVRDRADPCDQVFGRVVGERGDSVGTGVGERSVDLAEGGVDLPPLNGQLGNDLLTPLLVLGEGGQMFPKIALSAVGLLYPHLGGGDFRVGTGDSLMVLTAPPALAGVVESDLAVRQHCFGLLALPDGLGQLPASFLALLGPVLWHLRVNGMPVALHRGTCIAELFDPVGKGVVCSHAGDDDGGPVVVEVSVQASDAVSPPAFGRLEAPVGILFLLEPCHLVGDLVVALSSGRSPPPIVLQAVLHETTAFPAVAAQSRQGAQILELGFVASRGDVRKRQCAPC